MEKAKRNLNYWHYEKKTNNQLFSANFQEMGNPHILPFVFLSL